MDLNQQPTEPAPPPTPAAQPTPDAPDQETMAAIRRRRLEKLGGPASSPSASPKPPTGERSTASAAPTTAIASSSKSADQITRESETVNRPKINISPAAPPQPTTATPPPRKQTPKEESIEDYTNRMLENVFRVTVDPSRTADSFGHKLTFLEGLSGELAADLSNLKLSLERVEEAIMEAATAFPLDKPLLDYLLPCWKRVARALKTLRGPVPQKEEVLKEARRLCFSNCIFAVTMPELFGREPNVHHDTLVPYLLRDVEAENGLCMDFFTEAVSRLDDDDSIKPLFTKAMVDISTRLSTLSMNDNYKPYVNALLTYSRFPPLLDGLAENGRFQMAQSAPGIEKHTLLGPFFRISPLQPEVTAVYFSGPRTMDKGRIATSQSALQMTLTAHQSDLRTIINAFIRASAKTKNRVLDWFAYIMNANHKRRAIQVDPKEVSSDGFMVNVTVILDYLCEPFMDTTFSKVGRIDINYFRRNPRLDIKEETKLNADQSESDAFYATRVDGESNFITEVFFLALASHHYGSEATNSKMKTLDKDIKYMEKQLAAIEAERPKLAHRPDQIRLLEQAVQRHTSYLEKAMALKFAIEGVLLDQKMQSRSLQFMRYVAVWLLRVASQSDYTPDKSLRLPLSAAQPEAFSCLPEYALQDIVDNLKFLFRYVPQVILSAVGDEMIALSVTFLESSEYIRNPYLKSSLVSLLFQGTWPIYHLKKGVLADVMTNTKFANDYLLHAIMKFYIECESTGAHTQFYDKFNIRYEIFQIIKCIWVNDVYKQQLTQSSKSNRSFFVRFVNLLMNDATYVLDEGLSKFPKIHELQEKLKGNLSQQDREKAEEELKNVEQQATSYMQLVNETVGMMKLFTNTLSEAFTMPEIVQRLAGMLDYNLDILTGPKSKTLKVDNAENYSFNPKTLLPEIIDIYLNLGSSAAFIDAVASDGRSYKPDTMRSAGTILRAKHLKEADELAAWATLCKKFETAKELFDRAEVDFDDAPAEFEDPIMGILMTDPVILPSKAIVDRSTITQHLLSDPKDPYTRQPMTIDDVIPDTKLKEQIEEWKRERVAAARQKTADEMDTTE
ncbi:ubiquitin elongating factor core-domain-containing protein [Podospora didyma]|uniref:Ubiquitin elongating factor core-domain-containing protein n=1 Tax=Podospora didyma TaxID=330526 RepID=A0AAE0NU40_9PEZI|nr:ubiquitin elongating factor core-domain-containing protein [Podospora didyma]